jgi:hypothetical protein
MGQPIQRLNEGSDGSTMGQPVQRLLTATEKVWRVV